MPTFIWMTSCTCNICSIEMTANSGFKDCCCAYSVLTWTPPALWCSAHYTNNTHPEVLLRSTHYPTIRSHNTIVLLQELDRRSQQSESALCQLQERSTAAADQMRQLEASLDVCKRELHLQVEQLQQAKLSYEKQLQHKMQQVQCQGYPAPDG